MTETGAEVRPLRGLVRRAATFNLFVAFAFTVMADPVSSVAYAIEAALGGLDHELRSLMPTMAVIVAIIALVAVSYQQLIARFPDGGGGAKGLAEDGHRARSCARRGACGRLRAPRPCRVRHRDARVHDGGGGGDNQRGRR